MECKLSFKEGKYLLRTNICGNKSNNKNDIGSFIAFDLNFLNEDKTNTSSM